MSNGAKTAMSRKRKAAPKPTGPKTLEGSQRAKQLAAMILEVLSGLQGPTTACELLNLSLPRYYSLETRALQALILALEPRPRGRVKSQETRIAELEAEKARLERELLRSQALIRSAHRAIGLKPASTAVAQKGGRKKRSPNRQPRAKKIVQALRVGPQEPAGASQAETP